VFDLLVIALAVLGVVAAAVRRRWVIAVAGVTAPVALYYFVEHSSAWIQLKAFTITAAFAITLAFAGVAALQSNRRRWVSAGGWLAALTVAAGVLYGNALIYHDTTLAPGARYHDLAAIGSRYGGQGPALDPSFDEYAEFFLRGEHGTSLVDPANFKLEVRRSVPSPPGGQSFSWDLNQLVFGFVQSFPLIVEPRSPTSSRAPSNYDLVERTRYYDVWRRDRPASTVIEHFPLSSLPHERTQHYCRRVVEVARGAGAGAEIAYAQTATAAVTNLTQGTRPSYWRELGPGTVAARGAGVAQMTVKLPVTGRYSLWLQGSVGRPVAIYVDGRRVTSVGYEERYPDQFLLLREVRLSAGTHTVRVVRGNGSLHPGSGDPPTETIGRTLGAIVFNRVDASNDRVYVAPASRAAQVCAAPVGYQWLEVLRPGGAPPDALPAKV
jgi:hypothetical protein